MKKNTTTKTLIVIAGLCSAVCFAQGGGGGGGSGGGGGGAGGGSGSGSAGTASGGGANAGAPGSPSAASAAQNANSQTPGSTPTTLDTSGSGARASGTAPGSVLSTSPTGSTLATPNMNTVSPSQSVTDPAGLSSVEQPGATPRSGTTPGASSLSGLPQSQIPTTSIAPPPIAADGSIAPRQDAGVATAKTVEPIVPAGANSLPADRKMSRTAVGDTAGTASVGPAPAVNVPSAPPAAMRESTPSTSNEGQVWVPGHYAWTGERWNWNFGSWQRPPMPGATWTPGNYDAQAQRWTPGYWNPGAGAPTGR